MIYEYDRNEGAATRIATRSSIAVRRLHRYLGKRVKTRLIMVR